MAKKSDSAAQDETAASEELELEAAEAGEAIASPDAAHVAMTPTVLPGGPPERPNGVMPGKVWHQGKCKPFNPKERGAKYELASPNKGFNGERGGVQFREGLGYTDDDDIVPWFESLKFTVTKLPAKKK